MLLNNSKGSETSFVVIYYSPSVLSTGLRYRDSLWLELELSAGEILSVSRASMSNSFRVKGEEIWKFWNERVIFEGILCRRLRQQAMDWTVIQPLPQEM